MKVFLVLSLIFSFILSLSPVFASGIYANIDTLIARMQVYSKSHRPWVFTHTIPNSGPVKEMTFRRTLPTKNQQKLVLSFETRESFEGEGFLSFGEYEFNLNISTLGPKDLSMDQIERLIDAAIENTNGSVGVLNGFLRLSNGKSSVPIALDNAEDIQKLLARIDDECRELAVKREAY